MVGNRNKTYNEAINNCCNEPLISLSRDNITSNAMKINLEENNLDRKLIENLKKLIVTPKERILLFHLLRPLN